MMYVVWYVVVVLSCMQCGVCSVAYAVQWKASGRVQEEAEG